MSPRTGTPQLSPLSNDTLRKPLLISSRICDCAAPHSTPQKSRSAKLKSSRHFLESMATQLAGAPEPNDSSSPSIVVVKSARVEPAGIAVVAACVEHRFELRARKLLVRSWMPSVKSNISVGLNVPENSMVSIDVTLRAGLPCVEKPPSTVPFARHGAYVNEFTLHGSRSPNPMIGFSRPPRKSFEKPSTSITSRN